MGRVRVNRNALPDWAMRISSKTNPINADDFYRMIEGLAQPIDVLGDKVYFIEKLYKNNEGLIYFSIDEPTTPFANMIWFDISDGLIVIKKRNMDNTSWELLGSGGDDNTYDWEFIYNQSGKQQIPSEYLPSYVDDVLEYGNLSLFPTIGESGKIYIALDTNFSYRWGSSQYIQIGGSGSVDKITLNNGNIDTTIEQYNTNGGFKITNEDDGAWISFEPSNSTFAPIRTSATKFYFANDVYFAGSMQVTNGVVGGYAQLGKYDTNDIDIRFYTNNGLGSQGTKFSYDFANDNFRFSRSLHIENEAPYLEMTQDVDGYNFKLEPNDKNYLNILSNGGSLRLGYLNSTEAYIETEANTFTFNKQIKVYGNISTSNYANTFLSNSSGNIFEKGKRVYSDNNQQKNIGGNLIYHEGNQQVNIGINAIYHEGNLDLSIYELKTHDHNGVYSTPSDLQSLKDEILGGASPAYDTLLELQNELQSNDGELATLLDLVNTHDHDLEYSTLGHNHSGLYAPSSHSHDTTYSLLGHTHNYSLDNHDHDGIYEPIHSHPYALDNHNHNDVYSLIHSHPYSLDTHNHDDTYLPLSGGVLDGGTNTVLTLYSDDDGESVISLYGVSQGSGRLYVGQSISYGGGIEYNGDSAPDITGAGSDYVTLYRKDNGLFHWTMRNKYNDNVWEFRDTPKVGSTNISLEGHTHNYQTPLVANEDYVPSSGGTITGTLLVRHIQTYNGDIMTIGAGETSNQLLTNASTGEHLWLGAENGIRLVSSPDNWSPSEGAWGRRNEAHLLKTNGESFFPNNIYVDNNLVYHAGNIPTFQGGSIVNDLSIENPYPRIKLMDTDSDYWGGDDTWSGQIQWFGSDGATPHAWIGRESASGDNEAIEFFNAGTDGFRFEGNQVLFSLGSANNLKFKDGASNTFNAIGWYNKWNYIDDNGGVKKILSSTTCTDDFSGGYFNGKLYAFEVDYSGANGNPKIIFARITGTVDSAGNSLNFIDYSSYGGTVNASYVYLIGCRVYISSNRLYMGKAFRQKIIEDSGNINDNVSGIAGGVVVLNIWEVSE